MPSLGADMKQGTLITWLVAPGDRVEYGQVIAEIETDKGLFEIETFEAGRISSILVEEQQRVPVGTVLAVIQSAEPAEGVPGIEKKTEKTAADKPERIKASPSARVLAKELGTELSTITGSGPGGVITRGDVELATSHRPQATDETSSTADYAAGMRKAIAAAMSLSNREIPHYYLECIIDMSRALHWLEMANRQRPIQQRLLPAVLLARALVKSLDTFPDFNGFWVDGEFQPQEGVHLGFAISLRQGGLIAPALRHAESRDLSMLREGLHDLITRARSGKLRGSEMTDASITMTSLGDLGVTTVHGVIYPPQVALVGFGRISERPWAEGGMLGVRPQVTATLAADHRASDGHRGGQFLDAINRQLQKPDEL
ncbi:MAG: dihydrolipoamide acetyltransferase family protein [Desulfuromonadales bacterium]|nr:dihydrolipoamide acetyltransferase family protein [Desulfuromonadales bacterium]